MERCSVRIGSYRLLGWCRALTRELDVEVEGFGICICRCYIYS
jgi:hypothetical protein